jgi:serine/threonine protein kinase
LKIIIGKGGFAEVLKAKNRKNGKTYAIKHIKNAFKDLNSTKRLLREIMI